MTTVPRAPVGLGREGAGLWRSVVAGYELNPAELAILHLAAKQADALARMEKQLAAEGLTVEGSKGQPRVNPLVSELRQGRLALSRLVASLALPTEDDTFKRDPASRHAQLAARTRWARVRRIEEARRGDTA